MSWSGVSGSLREWLPRGDTLPREQWESRHRGMTMLLWAHVVALPLLAFGYGNPWWHSLAEGLLIAIFAGPATLLGPSHSRRVRGLIVTFGLLTCSATLVHIMNGAIEAHFHYFVVVTVLALYEDWTVYLTAIGYVLVQHLAGGTVAHHSVFVHSGSPLVWAAVHAGFIAALSVANIVNWRAAEALRAETQAINAQLSAHARELERSNRELEEFAYVASHDLAEPLRSIASYMELIERKVELDDQTRQYFTFATDGARRMRRLIDDLLHYSRTGRAELRRTSVPTRAVVDDTLRDLAAQISAAGAQVECGDLPVVEADPGLLGQLFQNLVANAVKFRADEPPVVKISASSDEHAWQFTVQDNGIGVPPDRAREIFKVFHRLHHRTEYEGTGIGLSVCQRIVERHGGRITVEPGDDGHGSRFVFTIPRPA